jgi:hypothetical protein
MDLLNHYLSITHVLIYIFIVRNLPFSLWHSSKYFRLSSCKFKFDKDMAETARIYFQIK